VRLRSHAATDRASGRAPRQRNILAVTDKQEPKEENSELQQRMAELEEQLKQVTQSGARSVPNSSKKSDSRRRRGRCSAGQNSDAAATGANKPSPQMHPCTFCNELGHWRRDCPARKNRPREEASVNPILTVSANMSPTKIYVTAEINGQPAKCLLDSGCERSVILADLVPNASLKPSQYTLFAANKANLDVLSDTVLPFVIDGHTFQADVSVCSKVEDFFLGNDWLEKQGAQWDFASGTVTLGDWCIKVHHRNRAGICRRVVVASDCVVPAKHEANVLVCMEDDGLTLPPYDWAIELQGLGPNVMTACTLFSDSQPQLVARVLNNSCEDKILSADSFLSMAEPVQCLSDDGHKPASLRAKGDKSQYDALFWGESASPVPSDSPSSQMTAGETALRASSVSTAIDEATASSSSTPSTEGLQDHIESLLQRLPNKISLNQKSPPNSVVGAHEYILPYIRWPVHAIAFAHTPTGYKTHDLGQLCHGHQNGPFYNLCRIVLATLSLCAHHLRRVARAGPETIGPLYHPTSRRCSRPTGLMTFDDLDSADLPDTPSQGAVMKAAETRPPLTAAERPAACFVRHLRQAEQLP